MKVRPGPAVGGAAITLLLSILLTSALAWPVLGDPRTQLFGHELVGRHHDPFTVMEQYAAGQTPPPYVQPTTDYAGVALARLAGAVNAYQILVLVTFPLAALAAFAHARHVSGSPVAAAIAALLFAMSPFHVAHAAYHVHIAQIQWIPLFFLALWRLVERPGLWRALLAAGALALVGGASFYLGLITAVVAPVAAIVYATTGRHERRVSALGWSMASLAGLAGAATIAVWMKAPDVLLNRSAFAFPISALDEHTARWWSYLVPTAAHPWLAGLAAPIWRSSGIEAGLLEQQMSVGVSVLTLAAIAVWTAVPRGKGVSPCFLARFAPALIATGAVALLCSLPPVIHIGTVSVPMPSQWLHDVAPMFRAFARFGVIVSLVVTTLAGAGAAMLLQRRSRGAIALAVALLVGAGVEYLPPRPASRDVLPTMAHRSLVGTPGLTLFDCAPPTPGATAALEWLMGARVMLPAGPLADCTEPDIAAKLAAFGVTHMVIRRDWDPARWIADRRTRDGLEVRQVFPDSAVFAVATPGAAIYVAELPGFYPREFAGADSWRWMGPTGSITVANTESVAVVRALELELEPLGGPRQLRVRLDGALVATLTATGHMWHRIWPLDLTPGTHVLTIAADGTVTPESLGIGSDPRALSVRLRRWRWQ